eukprot:SM000114S24130  [mRNA]  locus=s114:149801:154183:- [translate_table: standard]
MVYTLSVAEEIREEKIFVFYQLSDVHLDLQYRSTGTKDSACREPGEGTSPAVNGRNGCDTPLSLLRSSLATMAHVSKRPDFILVTGDSAAHNVSSRQDVTDAVQQVHKEIRGAFPDRLTRILYAVGGNDMMPSHSLGGKHTRWLAHLARTWHEPLSEASPDALATFRRGGYYTALIDAPARPGRPAQPFNMAVIVLNTVYYSMWNRAVSRFETDPGGQLSWLENELDQARHWGRKILIAGHMPPGVNMRGGGPLWHPRFEERYLRTVLTYSDVIVGQLFGYLHRDQFRLMRPLPLNAVYTPPKDDTPAETPVHGMDNISNEALDEADDDTGADLPGPDIKSAGELPQVRGSEEAVLQPRASVRKLLQLYAVSQVLGMQARAKRSLGKEHSPRGLSVGLPDNQKSEDVGGGDTLSQQVERRTCKGSAILIAPSLSPIFFNRPAFRLFRYDRYQQLIDYTQHTANFKEPKATMWKVHYQAQTLYGVKRLDSENMGLLASSFFNASGHPTEKFGAFCSLRAAGSMTPSGEWPPEESRDCCESCPRTVHCSLEYSTYGQYEACQDKQLP